MNAYYKTISALVVVLGLSACATSSPPKREVYTGQDQVGQISRDMIIGDWEVTILNPIEGEQGDYKPVTHYSSNGTVTLDAKIQNSGLSDIEMEVSGTWSIEGDLIKQVATDVREKSNSGLGMVIKLVKGSLLKNNNATLNIYEASANRLLIVSNHGQAQELIRVK